MRPLSSSETPIGSVNLSSGVEYQFDADSITSYSLDPIEKYGADPVGGVFLEANLPQEYHPGDDIKMYSPKDAGSLVSLGGIPKKPPLVAGSRLLIWCPTTAGQKKPKMIGVVKEPIVADFSEASEESNEESNGGVTQPPPSAPAAPTVQDQPRESATLTLTDITTSTSSGYVLR
jgi:hypothetical protein